MGYELIVTEKPSSSKKIAEALSNGTPIVKKKNGVQYYEITHGKRDIVVACAVGHLYSVAEKAKKATYPSFDIEWKPAFEVSKNAAHTKKFHSVLKSLCKKADEVTVACDYDIEGEVIGLNVVREICKLKDANRMKYSTLTKKELVDSYANKSKTLDWPQANAGETRHFLDWMYGINVSRALTNAFKTTGGYMTMSSGRVQSPALKMVVDKEKEIQAFVPEPFWQVELEVEAKGSSLRALHEADKFNNEAEAKKVHKNASQKEAVVAELNSSEFKQAPPAPFDLTSLQTEAYKVFGINPKETLAIAQTLYLSGVISYPRTSSQQLPASLKLKEIIKAMSSQAKYKELANKLLALKSLTPNNGKKNDPAHPAIHCTGEKPNKLGERSAKLYDLIVRRTFATFGEPAVRETNEVVLDSNGERFKTKGTRTVSKGWHVFYEPHLRFQEVQLPSLKLKDSLPIVTVDLLAKETSPPKRFTPASIIKMMEKLGLGTKSTRAATVDTLHQRGYIEGQSIEATQFGLQTSDILNKYVPDIVDSDLTKQFEDYLVEIRSGSKTEDEVLDEAKKVLTKILKNFVKHAEAIGKELKKSRDQMHDQATRLGPCTSCKDGTLMIKRSRFGLFVACSAYPDCKATYGLPSALCKPTGKQCEHCEHPVILVIKKRKRPEELCINPLCPSKETNIEKPEGNCPKCDAELVMRKSIYGAFYGCSKYPKCRYTNKTTKD